MYKFLLVVVLLFVVSCKEKESSIEEKFSTILAGDMDAILDGLDTTLILPQPYDTILEWQQYDEGIYSHRAVVEFYFYRTIPLKIVRKYRYSVRAKKWERYVNRYVSIDGHLKLNETLKVDSSVVMPTLPSK